MTDQERTKAAVEFLESEAYQFDGNPKIKTMFYEWIELLRPIAAGTSVIMPIEPTPKMIGAAWKLVRDRWPRGQFLGEGPAFKECMIAMIAASQEGE